MVKNLKFGDKPINQSRLPVTHTDIYSGEENIQFNNRHPIYRALMKIEFEEVLRSYRNMIAKD